MADSADASSSFESSTERSLSDSSSALEEEEDSAASDGAIEPYMYEPVASDSVSVTVDEEEPHRDERLHSTDW